jgi:hypothetical protein
VLRRFATRIDAPDRRSIHGDASRLDDLRAYLANGTADPLDLSIPRVLIDTTRAFPDPTEVARRIHQVLDEQAVVAAKR